ncbi:TetR family transcriptional regulator [Nocardioides baekrokdamisoli]|uniref:TetR family transcriptional regulator n=1 Tax=Nocardioides baekrokdamisoli TaxID=1804624 RepID=A0A3G9IIW0_9ACTN|nr:TetR/AcrR family transcriptional regulator [Nocardioides baekrokdamisoli]BBH18102.1 TetR family transcriptional regulator [Nocardioides baekrokdamisoli]
MVEVRQRPRVEGDREDEILEATIDLLVAVGYDRLTMDAVAKQAKASKATLYRRWESKAALVIDALVKAKDMPNPAIPATGTLRGDLIETFCGHTGIANSRAAEVMGAVLTATHTDPDFATTFRERFIGPKLAVTQAIYRAAVERGEVSPDIDLEIIGPALAAIVLHRSYLLGEVPTSELVTRVIDHVILPAATFGAPVQTR